METREDMGNVMTTIQQTYTALRELDEKRRNGKIYVPMADIREAFTESLKLIDELMKRLEVAKGALTLGQLAGDIPGQLSGRNDGAYILSQKKFEEISEALAEINRPVEGVMIKVTSLTQTCYSCPSQWNGMTADNRQLYFRYRWGWLTVTIGAPGDMDEFAAVTGDEVYSKHLGDEFDGTLSEADMMEATKDILDYSSLPNPALKQDIDHATKDEWRV